MIKASKLFVTFYETIGTAHLRNRPTFMSRLFKAAGSTHDVAEEKPTYTQSDYRYKLCNGTKSLSLEIKRGFPTDENDNSIVDTAQLSSFFFECMRKKEESCAGLIKAFDITSAEKPDAECLAMALALQFKVFIDEKEKDSESEGVSNVISSEYERLIANKKKKAISASKTANKNDTEIAAEFGENAINKISEHIQSITNMATLRKFLFSHSAEIAEEICVHGVRRMTDRNNAELRKLCCQLIEADRTEEVLFDISIRKLADSNQNELYKVLDKLFVSDEPVFQHYFVEIDLLKNQTLKGRFIAAHNFSANKSKPSKPQVQSELAVEQDNEYYNLIVSGYYDPQVQIAPQKPAMYVS